MQLTSDDNYIDKVIRYSIKKIIKHVIHHGQLHMQILCGWYSNMDMVLLKYA